MDEEAIRSLFPGTGAGAYFNAAAAALVPTAVREAMDEVVSGWVARGIRSFQENMAVVAATREAAARLLSCEPAEIAFTANTAEGISRIACGLEWRWGDEVVLGDMEYPANVYPWAIQQRNGVRLRIVRSVDGQIPADRLIDSIGPNTRVVAVSMVQFGNGYRVDLESLGRVCRERGVLLAVDAIQGLGVFPVDVKGAGIGALAVDGRKWLMGPAGAGFLFVDSEWTGRIRPVVAGALSVGNTSDFMQYLGRIDDKGILDLDDLYRPGAGRYEAGYYNVAGLAGLGAALQVGEAIGGKVILERVTALEDRLRRGLRERGLQVHGSSRPEERSGIVSFSVPGEAEAVFRALESSGYSLAVRDGRLRAAPHVYNTFDEVDALLHSLDEIVG